MSFDSSINQYELDSNELIKCGIDKIYNSIQTYSQNYINQIKELKRTINDMNKKFKIMKEEMDMIRRENNYYKNQNEKLKSEIENLNKIVNNIKGKLTYDFKVDNIGEINKGNSNYFIKNNQKRNGHNFNKNYSYIHPYKLKFGTKYNNKKLANLSSEKNTDISNDNYSRTICNYEDINEVKSMSNSFDKSFFSNNQYNKDYLKFNKDNPRCNSSYNINKKNKKFEEKKRFLTFRNNGHKFISDSNSLDNENIFKTCNNKNNIFSKITKMNKIEAFIQNCRNYIDDSKYDKLHKLFKEYENDNINEINFTQKMNHYLKNKDDLLILFNNIIYN